MCKAAHQVTPVVCRINRKPPSLRLFKPILMIRAPSGGTFQVRKAGLMVAGHRAESQVSELQNMRVLLEVARELTRNLAYHRRARLEGIIGQALDEVDQQIEELRRDGRRHSGE
jgi:hypothetical protein